MPLSDQQIDLDDTTQFASCFRSFRPFPPARMLAWCIENVVNDQGRPYDHYAYPHLGAPGGPMDAYDDPRVRTISEQFATRLGKTFFGLCALLYNADMDPSPMLLASESQDALKRVMGRLYKMIYQRPTLERKLLTLSRKDHKQDFIRFRECDIRGAWARSAASLADVNIKVGLANEIDKEGWTSKSTTKEGEPIKLFDDRFKDYQSVKKVVYECTPTVKGASRIERQLLSGTNCRLYVPCPHCQRFQTLRMGGRTEAGKFDPASPGRIEWDRTAGGKSDRDLARATARYICLHCEQQITNQHRPWMMRRGVWVPEGCGVDDGIALRVAEEWCEDALLGLGESGRAPKFRGWEHAEWITGHPARNGPDASYQLSSFYALSLGWGDIASEFLSCKDRPQYLRNFRNQWEGETWDLVERQQSWEQLGQRLIVPDHPRFLVPEWSSLLTVGVDRQQDRFVWSVEAWGADRRSMTIGYGESETLVEVVEGVCRRWYPHADSGPDLMPAMTLVDSGYRPEGVYEACRDALRQGLQVVPCKGSNKSLESDYRLVTLGKDTSMPGMALVHVDTIRTQCWIDKVLHTLGQNDPGGTSLHGGTLEEHQDYLEQLLNDSATIVLDPTNNEREVWERVDVEIPNDYRDCKRYAYVAMLLATRGRPLLPRSSAAKPAPAVVSAGASRPDGRTWISSKR